MLFFLRALIKEDIVRVELPFIEFFWRSFKTEQI